MCISFVIYMKDNIFWTIIHVDETSYIINIIWIFMQHIPFALVLYKQRSHTIEYTSDALNNPFENSIAEY